MKQAPDGVGPEVSKQIMNNLDEASEYTVISAFDIDPTHSCDLERWGLWAFSTATVETASTFFGKDFDHDDKIVRESDQHAVSHVIVVRRLTDGALIRQDGISDEFHYSADGYETLGRRFVLTAIRLIEFGQQK